jgi:DNA ligase-associated metallophosphoesterase
VAAAAALRWAEEDLECLCQRAVWWARRRTLIIADVHLGKPAAFRSLGVPVPEGATRADLDRLSMLIDALGAERLVILGDLVHARRGMTPEVLEAVASWRAGNAGLDVLLIRGNHDRSTGEMPASWGLRVRDQVHADEGDGAIGFAHEPEHVPEGEPRAVLCGHLHPAAVLDGPARTIKAPCFWFGRGRAVLPAFGSFTGTLAVRPREGDRVLVVGDGAVVEVTRGGTGAVRRG